MNSNFSHPPMATRQVFHEGHGNLSQMPFIASKSDRPKAGNFDPALPSRNIGPALPAGNFGPALPAGNFGTALPAGNFGTALPAGNFDPALPAGNLRPAMPAGTFGPEGLPESSPGRKPGVGRRAGFRPEGAAEPFRRHVLSRKISAAPPGRIHGLAFRGLSPPATFGQALRASARRNAQAGYSTPHP